MRKAEEFDVDVLKSNDEYIDMISNLQNMYGEGDRSNALLDDMIFRLIKGLNARFTMTEKAARVNTKRQFKDWKVMQKYMRKHKEGSEEDPEPPEEPTKKPEVTADEQTLVVEDKPKNSLLLAFKRVFKIIGKREERPQIESKGAEENPANVDGQSNSLSEAPPKAEQPTTEAEVVEEAKEGEVVKDNEEQNDVEEADDESDADEDVLKF